MEKKTVYQTDEHGFFLYSATAHELYLSPGNFNVPYGAVEVQPPAVESGKVPMWDGATWSVVEDHRDKTLYVAESGREYQLGTAVEIDGESVTYDGGGPIPAWLTSEPPVSDPSTSGLVSRS